MESIFSKLTALVVVGSSISNLFHALSVNSAEPYLINENYLGHLVNLVYIMSKEYFCDRSHLHRGGEMASLHIVGAY